jgi:hypothetical protein
MAVMQTIIEFEIQELDRNGKRNEHSQFDSAVLLRGQARP